MSSAFNIEQPRHVRQIVPVQAREPSDPLAARRIEDENLPLCERTETDMIVHFPMRRRRSPGSDRIESRSEDDHPPRAHPRRRAVAGGG